MPATLQPLRQLTREVRLHGPALLGDVAYPHDELMSLVWGPRFDREHALGLVARQPSTALSTLPALLAAADAFDALQFTAQRRLRELIRRHRVLSLSVHDAEDEDSEREGCANVDSAFGQTPLFATQLAHSAGGWARTDRVASM